MGFYYHNLGDWKIAEDIFICKTKDEILSQSLEQLFANSSNNTAKLNLIQDLATKIQNQADHIVVVGMGGSILSPMSLVKFCLYHKEKTLPHQKFGFNDPKPCFNHHNIHFIYYLDEERINRILATISSKSVAVLVLSNSGITAETVAICEYLAQAQNYSTIYYHWYAFTDLTKQHTTPLAQFLAIQNATIIQHDPKCVGRFSLLATQSLLLLQLIGVDLSKFNQGAAEVFNNFKVHHLSQSQNQNLNHYTTIDRNDQHIFDPVIGAKSIAYAAHYGFVAATMSYDPGLQSIANWYTIALAETLGKAKLRLIPENITLPLEQHCKMQNYLGSSVKVLMTFLQLAESNHSFFSDTIQQSQNSLLNAIKLKQIPHRLLTIYDSTQYNLGRLVGYLMLEVILAGFLSKINPFDQTEIDQVKQKINQSLQDNRNANPKTT